MSTALHPDFAFVRYVPSFSITPRTLWLYRIVVGYSMRTPALPGVAITDTHIGNIPVRIYRPEGIDGRLPVLVWAHGGGLFLGDHRQDTTCCQLARDLGIVVVSVDYRVAPEDPFPAAHDDLIAAVAWARGGPDGVDGARVAIGGQSAGAGLAAGVAQRLSDEGNPLAGQLLVYPMLDDRTAARTDIGPTEHKLWNNRSNALGWSSYLGVPPGSPDLPPYASPARREDLSGLPPAWVGIGTVDLLHDEAVDYARRIVACGGQCTCEVVQGAVHGFEVLAPRSSLTKQFYDSQLTFLRGVLGL